MMKKFTLLLIALLGTFGAVNAKNFETTLWEGTSAGDAEINILASKFTGAKSGDQIRITFSFTATSGSMHLCYKTGEGGDWNAKAFNGISEWPYFSDNTITTYECSINSTDLTTLQTYGMYIYGFNTSTITKIELTGVVTPASTTNISTDSYAADWDGKQYAAVSDAKIGDVLKFTYTATGTYFQIYVMNYAKGETFENKAYSVITNETYTYEYVIPDYATLKKVREEGFSIKGADFTISSVDLLTYNDSYGYVTITIGETGYATWSSDKKYDFASAGVTAYYASNVTTGTVTLTPMDVTWDWQGYILKATSKTYDVLESLTTDGTYYPSTNFLKPNITESSIAASVTGTYHYIFAKMKEGEANVGFYKLTSDHTLGANKAYLETTTDITPTTPGPAPAIHLVFEEENGATTVEQIEANDEVQKFIQNGQLFIRKNGVTYDLMGRTVK